MSETTYNYLLRAGEASPRSLEELHLVKEKLTERNAKTIKGNEFPLLPNGLGLYRGDLFGAVVATIYGHNSSVFQSPGSRGTDIFVDTNVLGSVVYANSRATGEDVCRNFEEDMRKRGYDIPAAGAVLLEFPKDSVATIPPNSPSQHGGRIIGPVAVSALSELNKQYILQELGLDSSSFAYQRLFPKAR